MSVLPQWKLHHYNSELLNRLSLFLNAKPNFIQKDMIDTLSKECNLTKTQAFSTLLVTVLGFDIAACSEDRELFENYFPDMVHHLDAATYQGNSYYKHIQIPNTENGNWVFCTRAYAPYEAFVCDDLKTLSDGRIIPQIGFFDTKFAYSTVLEQGREWMLITPNEITTMQPAIDQAQGRILTYGLGLGYFAYMVSEKREVTSVTVVENNSSIIQLFREHLLPQFPHAHKLHIVEADAFAYASTRMPQGHFDFIFTDLWHDPSDGVELYLKMKQFEPLSPQSIFMYWIEKTLCCYL